MLLQRDSVAIIPQEARGEIIIHRPRISGDVTKIVLQESSTNAPSAVWCNGRLIVAWVDAQHHINTIQTAIGTTWFNRVTLEETSTSGVSLANSFWGVTMAWSDPTNQQINLMSSTDGIHWEQKITREGKSPYRPAIVMHSGCLRVCWTDPEGHVCTELTDGTKWGFPLVMDENAVGSPTIASHEGHLLFMAYASANMPHNIVIMKSDSSGMEYEKACTLQATSLAGPSLRTMRIFERPYLYLTYLGSDANQSIHLLRSNDGIDWWGERIYDDSSDYTPELVEEFVPAIVWTGRDITRYLYVKTLD